MNSVTELQSPMGKPADDKEAFQQEVRELDAEIAYDSDAVRAQATCRCRECSDLVFRDGYCRPHWIVEVMGWNLTPAELRSIPLEVMTDDQLRTLEKKTKGVNSRSYSYLLHVLYHELGVSPIIEETSAESPTRPQKGSNVAQGRWAMRQLEADLHNPRQWVEDDRT